LKLVLVVVVVGSVTRVEVLGECGRSRRSG